MVNEAVTPQGPISNNRSTQAGNISNTSPPPPPNNPLSNPLPPPDLSNPRVAQQQSQLAANQAALDNQNRLAALGGNRDALNSLINSPNINSNKDLQKAYATGLLVNAGYTPTDALIQNALNGVQILGANYDANGRQTGIRYGTNLNENLGISDLANNIKPPAPKTFDVNLDESLGVSDLQNNLRNVAQQQSKAGGILSDLAAAENTPILPETNLQAFEQRTKTDPDYTVLNEYAGFYNAPIPENIAANKARQDKITSLLGLLGPQGNAIAQAQAKAKQSADVLSSPAFQNSNNPLVNPVGFIPQAFGQVQQEPRNYQANLSEGLGIGDQPKNSQDVVQQSTLLDADAGKATESFSNFFQTPIKNNQSPKAVANPLDFTIPNSLLGGGRSPDERTNDLQAINQINQDIQQAKQQGVSTLDVKFSTGLEKTYPIESAFNGILSDYAAQKRTIPLEQGQKGTPGFEIPGFSISGTFQSSKPTQLTPEQKTQALNDRSDIKNIISQANSKGDVLDIYSNGSLIGTTSGPRANFDIEKALTNLGNVSYVERNPKGPQSDVGQNIANAGQLAQQMTISGIPSNYYNNKNIIHDLSSPNSPATEIENNFTPNPNNPYEIARPKNIGDAFNYYASVAERSAGSLGNSLVNYALGAINPKYKENPPFEVAPGDFYSNAFSFIPAGAKKLENLGLNPINKNPQETRTPKEIFLGGLENAGQELMTDPIKVFAETPGFATQMYLLGAGAEGSTSIGNKISNGIDLRNEQKAANEIVSGLKIPKTNTIEISPPDIETTGKAIPPETGFFPDTIKTENIMPKIALEKTLENPGFAAVKIKPGLYEIGSPSATEPTSPVGFLRRTGTDKTGKPVFAVDIASPDLITNPSGVAIVGDIGQAETNLLDVPIKTGTDTTPISKTAHGIKPSAAQMRDFMESFASGQLKPTGTFTTLPAGTNPFKGNQESMAYYFLGKSRNEGNVLPFIPDSEDLFAQTKNYGLIGNKTPKGNRITNARNNLYEYLVKKIGGEGKLAEPDLNYGKLDLFPEYTQSDEFNKEIGGDINIVSLPRDYLGFTSRMDNSKIFINAASKAKRAFQPDKIVDLINHETLHNVLRGIEGDEASFSLDKLKKINLEFDDYLDKGNKINARRLIDNGINPDTLNPDFIPEKVKGNGFEIEKDNEIAYRNYIDHIVDISEPTPINEIKSSNIESKQPFNLGIKILKKGSKINPFKGIFSGDVFNPIESSYENIQGKSIKTAKRTSTFDLDVNNFLNPETVESIANKQKVGKGRSFLDDPFGLRENKHNPTNSKDIGPSAPKEVSDRYPLATSFNKETVRDIEKALTPNITTKSKSTPAGVYPYSNRRNKNGETTYEVIRYPLGTPEEITKHGGILNQFSEATQRGQSISLGGGSKQLGGQGSLTKLADQFDLDKIINPPQGKEKIGLNLGTILSGRTGQGQGSSLITIPTQGIITNQEQTPIQQGKLAQQQRQSQKEQGLFNDTFPGFEKPPKPIPPLLLGGGFGFPLYGLTTPRKKHGSRTSPSFFKYSVNPNEPGVIAQAGLPGKIVSLSPNLSFGKAKKKDLIDKLYSNPLGKTRKRNKKNQNFDIGF